MWSNMWVALERSCAFSYAKYPCLYLSAGAVGDCPTAPLQTCLLPSSFCRPKSARWHPFCGLFCLDAHILHLNQANLQYQTHHRRKKRTALPQKLWRNDLKSVHAHFTPVHAHFTPIRLMNTHRAHLAYGQGPAVRRKAWPKVLHLFHPHLPRVPQPSTRNPVS